MINLEDLFAYIHAMWCHVKRYGPKWHNLISSWYQISILQIRGPKWHLGISSRTAGVFNSISFNVLNNANIYENVFKHLNPQNSFETLAI